MKHSMCGGFLLAGLIVLGGCSGDPTGDLVGTGITLQPTPSSVFVAHGEAKELVVTVLDAQGNEQEITDFSFQIGTGATATEDTTYLRTSAGQLGTSKRIFVQGAEPTATTLTISANGQTTSVPVRVFPVATTVTLSNPAPAANEGLIITLPSGYKFGSGGGATVSGTQGITTGLSPDSSAATVVLPPGTTGALTIDSVALDFIPGPLFSLPTVDSVTVGPATPLAGTDDPSTAPPVPVPPAGGTTALYDAPDFAASAFFRFYRFDVTEPGDYTVTLNWSTGSDLDLYLCFDLACDAGNFDAATADHPESITYTIEAPGTYWFWVNDFGEDAVGTQISFEVNH